MLENLTGNDGSASRELIQDLRTLLGLGRDQLAGIAQLIGSMREEPERLRSAIGVAVSVWEQWANRGLTKEQIVSDLRGLNVGDEAIANALPLLDAMEANRGALSGDPSLRAFERESAAFDRMLPDLLQTHAERFVAIHDGHVIDQDADEFALARRVDEGHRSDFVLIRRVCRDRLGGHHLDSPEAERG